VVLLISIVAIGYEALFRFQNPEPIPGKTITIIAAIGILINGGSAFLFFRDKDNDISIRSAFLHLASDALVSLGLVIGGIIIHYTHLYWIDPLLSIIICVVIIASTWKLFKDSLRLSLDGVPDSINMNTLRTEILSNQGIRKIHHIHVWAISTSQNAMTAHLVVDDHLSHNEINTLKQRIKHNLEHSCIHYTTLEIEFERHECKESSC
jgi:cobalt-zinc-cadmium efflux system protein